MRKIAVLAASLLALAACSSNDETLSGTTGTGTGTATDTASGTAGMGTGVSSSELGGAPVPGSARDFEVNVGDRIFFAYDSSVVDDAGRETLQRQATWLQQFPDVPVYIEGHTDATGTREYNLALGERRANAAKNYLFRIDQDMEEKHDLADKHPGLVKELAAKIDQWRALYPKDGIVEPKKTAPPGQHAPKNWAEAAIG